MAGNENKLAICQVLHTSAVAIGATFLALGITFFALGINSIMVGSEIATPNEIQHIADLFLRYYVTFIAGGMIIIVGSTILTIIAIQRLKKTD